MMRSRARRAGQQQWVLRRGALRQLASRSRGCPRGAAATGAAAVEWGHDHSQRRCDRNRTATDVALASPTPISPTPMGRALRTPDPTMADARQSVDGRVRWGQPGSMGRRRAEPGRPSRVHSSCASQSRGVTSRARVPTPLGSAEAVPERRPGGPVSTGPGATRTPGRCRQPARRNQPRAPAPAVAPDREGVTGDGRRDHETDARSRRALRASDPPLEPEDEAVHLRRSATASTSSTCSRRSLSRRAYEFIVRPSRRRDDPVRRHQEAGAGGHRRRGRPGRHVLREQALARRHAHQLPDREAPPSAQELETMETDGTLRGSTKKEVLLLHREKRSWSSPSAASRT